MKIFKQERKHIIDAFKSSGVTVAVYGLGKMGLPLAAVFAEKGAKVIGADINQDVVDGINKGKCHVEGEPGLAELVRKNHINGRFSATVDLVKAAEESDVKVILVPTFLDDNNNPDLSIVESVCREISKGLNVGDLVIQESTVPPRTTKDFILPLLLESGLNEGDFGLAHCPERTSSGRAIQDITGAYPKVVGGVDKASTDTASAIYSVINSKGVISVADATAAECVKVFEGLYRDVNIALSNELAVICEELGVNAVEIFNTANTQPYCNLHMPGCGVGGHCIPVYPYFIIKTVKTDAKLLKTARKINDEMAGYTVDLVLKGLEKVGRKPEASNVLVMGVTYRGDVKETRCSPAISIIKILKRHGISVFAYDPLLIEEVERFGAIPRTLDNIADIDAIVIASDHKAFKNIDWKKLAYSMRNKVLVDGRCIIDPKVKDNGIIAYSVGRF